MTGRVKPMVWIKSRKYSMLLLMVKSTELTTIRTLKKLCSGGIVLREHGGMLKKKKRHNPLMNG